MFDPVLCPRCHGSIPTAVAPGAHPGAMSRATPQRDIEICSTCGTDEIFNPAPVARWPVGAWAEETVRMNEFVAEARRNGGHGIKSAGEL